MLSFIFVPTLSIQLIKMWFLFLNIQLCNPCASISPNELFGLNSKLSINLICFSLIIHIHEIMKCRHGKIV